MAAQAARAQFRRGDHDSRLRLDEAAAIRPSPAPLLELPLRDSLTKRVQVVDLAALWAKLLIRQRPATPPLFEMAELRIESLYDVEGDACSIDRTLLRGAPVLAARIVRLHCGVHDTYKPLKNGCPHTPNAVADELVNWRATLPHGGRSSGSECRMRSPLALRLSARCHDMLCSHEACVSHAASLCIARLTVDIGTTTQVGAVGRISANLLRDHCETWIRTLPRSLAPMCDALTGECRAPPDAHPGLVHWPSVACVKQGGRALCAASDSHESQCTQCVVKPTNR